ncbi:Flp family type IVb pilin [Kocuria aegyptia]|uniref:Flp family type IVb pilin n=1 Tax=Kocuria aegyptia TaxID=330943 RepID=A0ABN2L4M5_9MICC
MLPLFITVQAFFTDTFERIQRNEKGATAVEYGLLIGLVAIVLVTTLALLGGTGGPMDILVDKLKAKMTAITL